MTKHKNHLNGKKYGGCHTTLIDAAEKPLKVVSKLPEVEKISLGFIKTGLRSPSKGMSVKITKETGCILMKIRGNTSLQDVRVYGDLEVLANKIRHALRREKMQVR